MSGPRLGALETVYSRDNYFVPLARALGRREPTEEECHRFRMHLLGVLPWGLADRPGEIHRRVMALTDEWMANRPKHDWTTKPVSAFGAIKGQAKALDVLLEQEEAADRRVDAKPVTAASLAESLGHSLTCQCGLTFAVLLEQFLEDERMRARLKAQSEINAVISQTLDARVTFAGSLIVVERDFEWSPWWRRAWKAVARWFR